METKKLNKRIQKRSIEIIEFENGTFKIEGPAWNLDNLNSEELIEAFMHWEQNNLEVYPNDLKIPKLIKDNLN